MTGLELIDVSFEYSGSSSGVSSVRASFPAGQLVALTGPNGSGKSTLLKLMGRILSPQSGQIEFEQRPIDRWSGREYARGVGYLPQDPDPVFAMRAIDVVVSGRAPYLGRFQRESDADYAAAADALGRCDAAHLAERGLDEMSGGERKRVFLARVLAGNPRFILLDEPLASVDVSHVQRLVELFKRIVCGTGASIVFATHDLNWASAYSDRMLVMNEGRLVLDSTPRNVMTPEVMSKYFGFSAEVVFSEASNRAWIIPQVPMAER